MDPWRKLYRPGTEIGVSEQEVLPSGSWVYQATFIKEGCTKRTWVRSPDWDVVFFDDGSVAAGGAISSPRFSVLVLGSVSLTITRGVTRITSDTDSRP